MPLSTKGPKHRVTRVHGRSHPSNRHIAHATAMLQDLGFGCQWVPGAPEAHGPTAYKDLWLGPQQQQDGLSLPASQARTQEPAPRRMPMRGRDLNPVRNGRGPGVPAWRGSTGVRAVPHRRRPRKRQVPDCGPSRREES